MFIESARLGGGGRECGGVLRHWIRTPVLGLFPNPHNGNIGPHRLEQF